MKKICLLITFSTLLLSCQQNGFISETGQQVQLGSESSVEIFKSIDQAWAERNYDQLRTLLHPDGTFTTADGIVLDSAEKFIEWIESDYQSSVANGQEFSWKTNFAFAVRVTQGEDQDNDDGDYVNARFTSNSTGMIYDEWYYIVDNKLKAWEQSTQGKPKSAGHLFGEPQKRVIGDQSSVEVVLTFVEALNQKDFELAGEQLDEEVEISFAEGSHVKGKADVVETFRKSHSNGMYTYRPVWGTATKGKDAINDNQVVNVFDVMVNDGKEIDVINMMLATHVKAGKIKGVWVHMRDFNPSEYEQVLTSAKEGTFLSR